MSFFKKDTIRPKRVGNYGILKCSDCQKWALHGVFSSQNNRNSGDELIYIACLRCGGYTTVPKLDVDAVLMVSSLKPDDRTATSIWNEMEQTTNLFLKTCPELLGEQEVETWHKQVTESPALAKFEKRYVNQVLVVFMKYFFDERLGAAGQLDK
jgi:hypothetical protein